GPETGHWAGDRREVTAENDPPVRRNEIAPVPADHRRRRARVVERENARRDELRIKAEADCVDASGGEDEIGRGDGLAAREGDGCEYRRPGEGDGEPQQEAQRLHPFRLYGLREPSEPLEPVRV